ncbi:MAG: hypothetical protein K9W44_14375 [Candidatus Lokiarchaeota archaeon]|nr:hypothetical protein [Candidatus Harpocratesius repetitus]
MSNKSTDLNDPLKTESASNLSSNVENSQEISPMSTSQVNVLTICYDNGVSCKDCPNHNKLMCQLDYKDSLIFAWPFLSFIGILVWGIIRSMNQGNLGWLGLAIFIVFYLSYGFFFFNIWESKILCSHCPFYVIDDSKTLKCYANYGFLKSAKYNPAPISKSEQYQFIIGASLLFVIPLIFLLIVQEFLFAGLVALFYIIFFLNTSNNSCKKCPNFSCILNRVPQDWKDEYLRRNPVMREAWEKAANR